MKTFSIIVPTYNRSDILPTCVASLRSQTYPQDAYEIIIVDNNSIDNTSFVIAQLNQLDGKKIRYVLEKRPDATQARHAGARVASGDILAFIDDDAIADVNWLTALARAYEELGIECAGGKILIRWDRKPPDWIIPYEPLLGKTSYKFEAMCVLQPQQMVFSGNLSIKKERLLEIGGFNPDLCGGFLLGDGESGLCNKIHKKGWKIAFVPNAVVWHCQIVDRNATVADIKRRFANNGVGVGYNTYRYQKPNLGGLVNQGSHHLIRGMAFKVLAFLYSWRKKEPYYLYEFRSAFHGGAMRYFLRLIYDRSLRELVLRQNYFLDDNK